MGICFFCKEKSADLLDAHRPLPGSEGGKYIWENMICECANCHRRIHGEKKEIVIDRKYTWSGPGFIVHYWVNGEERWEKEEPNS